MRQITATAEAYPMAPTSSTDATVVVAGPNTPPVDIATMRTTARDVLAESAPPDADWLHTSMALLRGHIDLMIPEVQALADEMPAEDIPRYCALACLGEARRKATIEARPGISSQLAHARRLARVLNALCDHHEGLDNQ